MYGIVTLLYHIYMNCALENTSEILISCQGRAEISLRSGPESYYNYVATLSSAQHHSYQLQCRIIYN